MKILSSNDYPSEPVVLENLSAKFMKQSKFVPLSVDDNMLRIAMADPTDFWTIDALKLGVGLDIEVVAGSEDDILEAVEQLYGAGTQSMEMIIEEAGRDIFQISDNGKEDVDQLRDLASEAPIIRLVNRIILKAVEFRASDIHFEPFEDKFKVLEHIPGKKESWGTSQDQWILEKL